MAKQILTPQQKLALQLIAKTEVSEHFYFGGGTALAYYYLQHRKSEDLDFFNVSEFDPQIITTMLKSLQSKLEFNSFDYQSSFNRNLFFLRFENEYVLKLEFTYFPFQQIEPPISKAGLLVDSPVDIAVNKLFTISQNPRGRDYFDLYFLIEKYNYTIEDLRMKAKLKFDWHVDPLQLAARLNEVEHHLDDPIIDREMDRKKLESFFHTEAKKFKSEILMN